MMTRTALRSARPEPRALAPTVTYDSCGPVPHDAIATLVALVTLRPADLADREPAAAEHYAGTSTAARTTHGYVTRSTACDIAGLASRGPTLRDASTRATTTSHALTPAAAGHLGAMVLPTGGGLHLCLPPIAMGWIVSSRAHRSAPSPRWMSAAGAGPYLGGVSFRRVEPARAVRGSCSARGRRRAPISSRPTPAKAQRRRDVARSRVFGPSRPSDPSYCLQAFIGPNTGI